MLRHRTKSPTGARIAAALVLALVVGMLTAIAPQPAEAATGCHPYPDVTASNPHCDNISWLKGQGITQSADGKYHPLQTVTRGSMTAFLYRLVNPGKAPAACTAKPYPDVATTSTFCPSIAWAKAKGIVTGYTNGSYGPAAAVSRGAMAAYLFRIANPGKAPAACTRKPFTDVPASQTFCGAINWLVGSGVTQGMGDGTYGIAQPVTRQAMASFLHRIFTTTGVLIQAAPPAWSPTGTATTLGAISLRRSPAWTVTTFDGDAVLLSSPPDSHGAGCDIAVFAPEPAPATESGRLDLARDYAIALGMDSLTNQDGGSDLLGDAFRGSTGNGWDYVGLAFRATRSGQDFSILSIMARFGASVVPLQVLQQDTAFGNEWHCVGYGGDFGPEAARVFHSLALGTPKPNNDLAGKVEGDWFSSSGSVGNGYTFGRNHRYLHASVYGGSVWVSPGYWADAYATWAGDGSWASAGDLVAFFPTGKAAHSVYARVFDFRGPGGQWYKTLCWVDSSGGAPYSYCTKPA